MRSRCGIARMAHQFTYARTAGFLKNAAKTQGRLDRETQCRTFCPACKDRTRETGTGHAPPARPKTAVSDRHAPTAPGHTAAPAADEHSDIITQGKFRAYLCAAGKYMQVIIAVKMVGLPPAAAKRFNLGAPFASDFIRVIAPAQGFAPGGLPLAESPRAARSGTARPD